MSIYAYIIYVYTYEDKEVQLLERPTPVLRDVSYFLYRSFLFPNGHA